MKHLISGKKIFQKIAKLVGNSIEKYNLIEEGDRILGGLSGGKDSWALMHVLHYLKYKAPIEFNYKGITFDPGFPNFGSDIINKYCQAHDWEHEIIKMNIPEIIDEKDFSDNVGYGSFSNKLSEHGTEQWRYDYPDLRRSSEGAGGIQHL